MTPCCMPHPPAQNGEVGCEDTSPQCPPTPCPLDQRLPTSTTCCPLCIPPAPDASYGSGAPPPVEVHAGESRRAEGVGVAYCTLPSFAGCWDEQGKLRQHESCWNITYRGQVTCIGACCKDGETSIVPPTCPPAPPCKRGEQPYSGPLQCCKQCLVGGSGGERTTQGIGDLFSLGAVAWARDQLAVFSHAISSPHPTPGGCVPEGMRGEATVPRLPGKDQVDGCLCLQHCQQGPSPCDPVELSGGTLREDVEGCLRSPVPKVPLPVPRKVHSRSASHNIM